MIVLALKGERLPVYGTGKNVRDWLHVSDHCSAIDVILQKGKPGDVYNVGGNCEMRNIDIVKLILKELGKEEHCIMFVQDRKGHDLRYAIDNRKITKELGWSVAIPFKTGIKDTIEWYKNNVGWLRRIDDWERPRDA